jgi:hypothetical protein
MTIAMRPSLAANTRFRACTISNNNTTCSLTRQTNWLDQTIDKMKNQPTIQQLNITMNRTPQSLACSTSFMLQGRNNTTYTASTTTPIIISQADNHRFGLVATVLDSPFHPDDKAKAIDWIEGQMKAFKHFHRAAEAIRRG